MFLNHKLSDCHTICHESDFSLGTPFLLKSDVVADLLAERFAHLKGDSFSESNGTDSSGLSD